MSNVIKLGVLAVFMMVYASTVSLKLLMSADISFSLQEILIRTFALNVYT